MNLIEQLRDDLARRFVAHSLRLDPPEMEEGLKSYWLDIKGPGLPRPLAVEWRPGRGFGVSSVGPDDYGSGPDEVYADLKETYDRLVDLIVSGAETSPPEEVRMAEH